MTAPRVSVVMAVYNGEQHLADSIDSIVRQTFKDWELILINDGSTDRTGAIIDDWRRRDARIRHFSTENEGLTAALIRGCREAAGTYIARLDCGDLSRPERLQKQFDLLEMTPEAVLASCGVAVVGPERQILWESHMVPEIEELLRRGDASEIRSLPAHSSAFFRRSAYEAVGGYRRQFFLAQDLDLWTRMVQQGRFVTLSDVLVDFAIDPLSISGDSRDEQIALTKLIVKLRDTKSATEQERLLGAAATIRRRDDRSKGRAGGYYFLSQVLPRRDPQRQRYLRLALQENPLHWKAALRLLSEWSSAKLSTIRRSPRKGKQ